MGIPASIRQNGSPALFLDPFVPENLLRDPPIWEEATAADFGISHFIGDGVAFEAHPIALDLGVGCHRILEIREGKKGLVDRIHALNTGPIFSIVRFPSRSIDKMKVAFFLQLIAHGMVGEVFKRFLALLHSGCEKFLVPYRIFFCHRGREIRSGIFAERIKSRVVVPHLVDVTPIEISMLKALQGQRLSGGCYG